MQPQEEKPFKMPIAWMKEGAPPEKPIQHAILGFAWLIVFICAKVMQAAKFDIWTILVSQVVIAESNYCVKNTFKSSESQVVIAGIIVWYVIF